MTTLGSHPLSATPKTDWVERIFQLSAARATIVIGFGLIVSWLATYLLGGAGRVPPHWFYIPILLAAARFGLAGTMFTAVIAGVLAGPLVPLDVAAGTSQPLTDWGGRAGFFIGNGLIMVIVIGRLKALLGRELDVVRAEQELARHKDAVIQTISHEFRTPLTAIRGTVDFFTEPGVVSEEAQPLLEGVARATTRLENLIKLVLAAGDALGDRDRRSETIALRDLCEDIVSTMDEFSGASRIRYESDTDAEYITGDTELIAVALYAVIENALKFSPRESPVDIFARRRSDAIEVCVRDRGPGVSDTDLRRIFEPFAQKDESVTRSKQGLGLGLYSARKSAEFLGGNLELVPVPDGGTEAILTIPQ